MRVWSLSREDPLEEVTTTHSSILAWRISWTKKPGKATVCELMKSWTRLSDWACMHVPYSRVWALSHHAVNLSPRGQEKCLPEYLGHFLCFFPRDCAAALTVIMPLAWSAYCLILSPGKWDLQSKDLGSRPGPPLPSCTYLKPRVTILLQSFAVRNKRHHEYWSTW